MTGPPSDAILEGLDGRVYALAVGVDHLRRQYHELVLQHGDLATALVAIAAMLDTPVLGIEMRPDVVPGILEAARRLRGPATEPEIIPAEGLALAAHELRLRRLEQALSDLLVELGGRASSASDIRNLADRSGAITWFLHKLPEAPTLQCGQVGCAAPAVARVFWPGRAPMGVCEPHLARAREVAHEMGFALHHELVER